MNVRDDHESVAGHTRAPATAAPLPRAARSAPAPLDLRGVAVCVLALIATVFALSQAQAFFVTLLLGIIIAYTLNPLVAWLALARIPRAAGTLIVMTAVIGAFALGTYALRGQARSIVEQLPAAASKFATGLARLNGGDSGNLHNMQVAATTLEEAASEAAAGPAAAPAPARHRTPHVIVDQPTFKVGRFLWGSSMNAAQATGRAAMVVLLAFFLLLGGDRFKRKLVRLSGPSLTQRKLTVRMLGDINGSIQKCLLMILSTNLLVALFSWGAFAWIGLDNAGAWGAAAGVLHVVPYLGPAMTALAAGMAALLQFDSPGMAVLVAGASLAIAAFVGTFVATWMAGRLMRMSPAAVFVALLFWGTLWGAWGLLLGLPIVVIVKTVSGHVPRLRPLADLLGE